MDNDLKALIKQINRNTAAMHESNKKWRQELGLPDPEPTELELLLQKWEQACVAPQSPEPEGEEPPLPEPKGEEPPLLEPRGEEPPLPEPRGEEPPLPEPRGEEKSIHPPQPRPPPLQSSSALLRSVPQPLLLDTLPVFLDLPVLDLEPRSLQHWPQLCPWFPAPLSPSTQTSLGCCQTSLLLPLFAASLPLGDRTSLRRFPGEDLCPLRHPPVPRPTLRSALSARWGPMSPVRGPFLAAPEGPTHPQARPCKRAAMDIAGLEAGRSVPIGPGVRLRANGMYLEPVPRSIEHPGWDWSTKPESCDFEELNLILQESRKLGKALENLSRCPPGSQPRATASEDNASLGQSTGVAGAW
ncbi:UNVERIFIED_CONTAM: hypothetical protein FKN15_057630 [Acipenser sinensis]